MSCPSEIMVPMGTYTPDKIRNDLTTYNRNGDEIAVYQAFTFARMLLKLEFSDNKRVIVISSGQRSTCNQPTIPGEDVNTIADEWHSGGVPVIYIGIGDNPNKTDIEKITHDPQNSIIVPNFKVSLLVDVFE
ncbi:hypothetical protein COOONC_16987 [Cooperia oncophora]